MTPRRFLFSLLVASSALALTAPLAGIAPTADARTVRQPRQLLPRKAPSVPVLAIVGLSEQRISIYDATGKVMEAPVSSGAPGYETPPGIFSIVQKEEDHRSNLYDDASMPFMERLTWTGIALHAGVLPGSPASHGCVRMPLEFADQLYRLTSLGMRVIVVREDMAPAPIAQPFLFSGKGTEAADGVAGNAIKTSAGGADVGDAARRMEVLKSQASSKALDAEAAGYREKELRTIAGRMAADAAQAKRSLASAQSALVKLEAELRAAELALQAPKSAKQATQAQATLTRVGAQIDPAKAKIAAAQADDEAKSIAAQSADEEAKSAAAAAAQALEASEEAKQNMSPVSVFVSRKTQRLYVRKGNMPVFEAPALIRDADGRIGTFVFTAVDQAEQSRDMRWTVVAMYKNPVNPERQPYRQGAKSSSNAEPGATDVTAAQAALDRLVIPQDVLDRLSGVVLPGSSLIISDEGPSIETGKDTDFVVLMSGEPQGGIAIRQRPPTEPRVGYGYDTPWGSQRGRKSYGGGGFFDLFGD